MALNMPHTRKRARAGVCGVFLDRLGLVTDTCTTQRRDATHSRRMGVFVFRYDFTEPFEFRLHSPNRRHVPI